MRFKMTRVTAMHDVWSLATALVAGVLLGGIFFGGLWWTVRKGLSSEWPALWFFGSLMLRIGIVLLGFFVVGQEGWARWLLCLVGFVLARLMVGRVTQPRGEDWAQPARGSGHAP